MKAMLARTIRSWNLKYRLLHDLGWVRTYELGLRIFERFYGKKIRLDASSVCQLKCPACSTASGFNKTGVVGWGHLRVEDFSRLLHENPNLKHIEVSNWGEIFLNPKIDEILKLAFENKVRLTAANGVNLNTVKESTLENLVRYRFAFLSVSIDGASQETYEQYRVRGNFDQVIENVRTINRFKKQYNTKFPKLGWQFVIFGHNEHELPKARAMAAELGMKLKTKLNHTPTHSPVRNEQYVRAEGGFGAASRDEFRQTTKKEYSFPCGQLWDNPQVNWDGKLLGCCVNKYGDFGNVFRDGLDGALHGETYRYAKQMVTGNAPARKDIPCYRCNTYWRMFPEEKTRVENLRKDKAAARAAKERRAEEKLRKQERKAAKLQRIADRAAVANPGRKVAERQREAHHTDSGHGVR